MKTFLMMVMAAAVMGTIGSSAEAAFKVITNEVNFENDDQKTEFFSECYSAANLAQKKLKKLGATLSVTVLATPIDVEENMDCGECVYYPRHMRCTLTFIDESAELKFVKTKTKLVVDGLSNLSPGLATQACKREMKAVKPTTNEIYRYAKARRSSETCVIRTISLGDDS